MKNGERSEYVRVSTIQKEFEISDTWLRKCAEQGKFRCIRTQGGNRLYHYGDIRGYFGIQEKTIEKKDIIYCRVSSQQQKEDLSRQVQSMVERFKSVEIIKDIGSGLNFGRKGFKRLLFRIQKGEINQVIIADKDRLCRFGFELFKDVCEYHGTKIMVLNSIQDDSDRELADDLLSICNVFVASKNGKRSARNRKLRKETNKEESIWSNTNQKEIEPIKPYQTMSSNPNVSNSYSA
jgi:predicted site-specific integrase-resolvase